jgi:hypothetical protein
MSGSTSIRGEGGNVAIARSEVTLDHGERRIRLEVSGDREDRVVRGVPGREEVADVVERGGAEVLHRADRRMMVGMPLGVDE